MSLKPTLVKSRISEIDVLRGFALFGVLLVNLTMINETLFGGAKWAPSGKINVYAAYFIEFFAQGKFYTIFSFLFGLGFFLFMNRASDKVLNYDSAYKRRLFSLFVFGVLHLVFVWFGDILHSYAICGLILYLNRSKDSSATGKSAIFLIVFSLLLYGWVYGSNQMGGASYDYKAAYNSAIFAYTQPDYFEMVKFRITEELPFIFQNIFIVTPKLLSLFFMGFYVGQKGYLKDLSQYKETLKKLSLWSGALFLATIFSLIVLHEYPVSGFWGGFLNGIIEELNTYLGACFYVTLVFLGLQNHLIKHILSPFQYSGRMALTNYLVQTVFWTTVIYGYGFEYFGHIPYYAFLPIAIVFYGVQILLSKLWLNHFIWGPAEWIWRRITYSSL